MDQLPAYMCNKVYMYKRNTFSIPFLLWFVCFDRQPEKVPERPEFSVVVQSIEKQCCSYTIGCCVLPLSFFKAVTTVSKLEGDNVKQSPAG